MKHLSIFFTLFYTFFLFSLDYPSTPQHPETLQYPGEEIVDPYVWLEEDSNPAVREWDGAQTVFTEAFLSQNPSIPIIEKRLNSLRESSSYTIQAGKTSRIITVEFRAEDEQPVYYLQKNQESEKIELLNGNTLGRYSRIESAEVSPDGRFFAYLLSEKGNEKPLIQLIDLNTLKSIQEPLAGSFQTNIVWHPNSKGFFYTANRLGKTCYHQGVYYHPIGTEENSLLLCDEKKIAWYYNLSAKGENLEIQRAFRTNKGLNLHECYHIPLINLAAKPKLKWRLEPNKPMHISHEFNGETFYLTNEKAPNFCITKKQKDKVVEFIPESDDLLLGFCRVGMNFAATYLSHGHTLIKIFDSKGNFMHDVPLPDIGIASISDSIKPIADLYFESMIQAGTTYKYNSLKNTLSFNHRLLKFDSSSFEVSFHLVKSHDGVKIPLYLAHKKRLQHGGDIPVLIYGYGGFSISILPKFDPRFIPWIEAGGAVAFTCLRGGGEYGEKWHLMGMRKHKQNTFEDCIAVAEWLIKNKYTNPSRLSIFGRSNGGLLVGAMITQRPDLFKAAFCGVALLDMLRFDLFLLGEIWIGEYGSPQNPKDYPILRKYSPYHYPLTGSGPNPAVLFIAGQNDSRVHPMHMRKMAAKLQTTYPEGRPVLYCSDPTIGHLFSSPNSLNNFTAKGLGFLMEQVNLSPPPLGKTHSPARFDLMEAQNSSEFLKVQKNHISLLNLYIEFMQF